MIQKCCTLIQLDSAALIFTNKELNGNVITTTCKKSEPRLKWSAEKFNICLWQYGIWIEWEKPQERLGIEWENLNLKIGIFLQVSIGSIHFQQQRVIFWNTFCLEVKIEKWSLQRACLFPYALFVCFVFLVIFKFVRLKVQCSYGFS